MTRALERNPAAVSAARPRQVVPPLVDCNRVATGARSHLDNAVRQTLSVAPAGSLHPVTCVTQGERLASCFRGRCLLRDQARQALLLDRGAAIVLRMRARQSRPSGARVADRHLSQILEAMGGIVNCVASGVTRAWSDQGESRNDRAFLEGISI